MKSFPSCLCYSMVPRSLWVSALSFWTVFLAWVNFRQQEEKEQTCPHDSGKHLWSRVQFEGYSSYLASSELKLCFFFLVKSQDSCKNAGNSSRMVPELPGGTKPRDSRGAASSPARCRERLQCCKICCSKRSQELWGWDSEGLQVTAAEALVLGLLVSMHMGSGGCRDD